MEAKAVKAGLPRRRLLIRWSARSRQASVKKGSPPFHVVLEGSGLMMTPLVRIQSRRRSATSAGPRNKIRRLLRASRPGGEVRRQGRGAPHAESGPDGPRRGFRIEKTNSRSQSQGPILTARSSSCDYLAMPNATVTCTSRPQSAPAQPAAPSSAPAAHCRCAR